MALREGISSMQDTGRYINRYGKSGSQAGQGNVGIVSQAG